MGRALRARLPGATFLARADLDVSDAVAVRSALRAGDVVVHTAAMTDVDGCERDPDAAFAVNAAGAAERRRDRRARDPALDRLRLRRPCRAGLP